MSRRGHGRPTASLFVQVLMLVGLSLIIAQAISLFLLFNLPPLLFLLLLVSCF